ncbi:CYTH domain-containing protein [Aquimarina litoralis]|uniref:CYTH domain-containing protein n=1 Tax=Aquimarina litoralis TaxID=584605 RepID=UPI001C5687A9|nr:CYTH domain-containing protein [Aquimarina litoralis]MBW1295203.1 CYTH domain-containing protein [Aquimarina litoralis]
MIEIERKFLVSSDVYKQEAHKSTLIIQGFLNTDPERTVRIRIKGEEAYITVKGKSNRSGTTRFEWEKNITVEDAKQLITICEKGVIKKNRYEIPFGDHVIEVDEFFEDNEGLIIAEIELKDENETFHKPDWLGNEVTGDPKYYNSQLSKHPFRNW